MDKKPAEKSTTKKKTGTPWAVEDATKNIAETIPAIPMGAENATEKTGNPSLLEWSAPEFVKYRKNPEWFVVGGLTAFGFLLFALFTKNLIFALIIILASFSIFIWTQKEPQKVSFAITNKGILINKKNLLSFDGLKSFWIFNEPSEIKYISLESKKIFMPRIPIPLGERLPEEVRQLLSKFLPEQEQEESLIDALGKHLRY